MVRCGGCGNSVQRAPLVTTQTRVVQHPSRYRVNGDGSATCIDVGGKGTQIAKQKALCEKCNPPVKA